MLEQHGGQNGDGRKDKGCDEAADKSDALGDISQPGNDIQEGAKGRTHEHEAKPHHQEAAGPKDPGPDRMF